jgi:PilZ domain
MQRLRLRDPVTINLDGAPGQIECYVRSLDGQVAGLGHFGELDPELRESMAPGAVGYLTFADRGTPVAIRGVATVDCGEGFDLAFLGLDSAKLSERRRDVRVDLATPASICLLNADGSPQSVPIETVTTDVSMGGVLIELLTQFELGSRLRADLHFSVFPTPIRCYSVLVRQTRTHAGLRFTEMQESDRVRLAGIIAEQQRRAGVAV